MLKFEVFYKQRDTNPLCPKKIKLFYTLGNINPPLAHCYPEQSVLAFIFKRVQALNRVLGALKITYIYLDICRDGGLRYNGVPNKTMRSVSILGKE